MFTHDSVTEFPVEQVVGILESVWSIRYWWWRRRSRNWPMVTATVEGRFLLRRASNAGWFCVVYRYPFEKRAFSGELRKWFVARKASRTEQVLRSAAFPCGDTLIKFSPSPDCAERSSSGHSSLADVIATQSCALGGITKPLERGRCDLLSD